MVTTKRYVQIAKDRALNELSVIKCNWKTALMDRKTKARVRDIARFLLMPDNQKKTLQQAEKLKIVFIDKGPMDSPVLDS